MKKKIEKIGTISGLEVLKHTRGPQNIPFRTGVRENKKKKNIRENIRKNNLDKWL